jgi:Ca2+-binding EF-hand superfamily protein
MHTEVIGNFVETYDTPVGRSVLKSLFGVADVNKNGTIDEEELAAALHALGFSWLQSKQVAGIFKRADLDENGSIDFDEFMKEAPKTLRTNLIKLAKKNGDEMGLMS